MKIFQMPMFVLLLLIIIINYARGAVIQVTAASKQWCNELNSGSRQAGDIIELGPGEHRTTGGGKCVVSTTAGTPELPIIVRSQSATNRASLQVGYVDNLVEVKTSNIVFQDIFIKDTLDFGIRLYAPLANNIRLERLEFDNINGQAVTANSGTGIIDNFQLINCTFKNGPSTVIYLGEQNAAMKCTNYLIEGCHLFGDSPAHITGEAGGYIGYGMEAKKTSWGTIRGNTFYRSKGPLFAIYGTADGSGPPTIVEQNLAIGTRNDAPFWTGGGPAIIRNNIGINTGSSSWPPNLPSTGFAYYSQTYGGMQPQNIHVVFNTFISTTGTRSAYLQGWNSAAANNVFAYNVVAGAPVSQSQNSVTAPIAAITGSHVDCTAMSVSACFVSATSAEPPWDLWVKEALKVQVPCPAQSPAWWPQTDFLGLPRICSGGGTTAGAFEQGATVSVQQRRIEVYPNKRPAFLSSGGGPTITTPVPPQTTAGTTAMPTMPPTPTPMPTAAVTTSASGVTSSAAAVSDTTADAPTTATTGSSGTTQSQAAATGAGTTQSQAPMLTSTAPGGATTMSNNNIGGGSTQEESSDAVPVWAWIIIALVVLIIVGCLVFVVLYQRRNVQKELVHAMRERHSSGAHSRETSRRYSRNSYRSVQRGAGAGGLRRSGALGSSGGAGSGAYQSTTVYQVRTPHPNYEAVPPMHSVAPVQPLQRALPTPPPPRF